MNASKQPVCFGLQDIDKGDMNEINRRLNSIEKLKNLRDEVSRLFAGVLPVDWLLYLYFALQFKIYLEPAFNVEVYDDSEDQELIAIDDEE